MKEYNLFPTPVIEFDFTNHPDLSKILDIVNQLKIGPHSLLKNGVSSYSTTERILFHPDLTDIRNDFQKCVDIYSNKLDIEYSYIKDNWVNILDNQGMVDIHHHWSSIISAAFYPLLEENTCNLCFRSPIYTAINFRPKNTSTYGHFQNDYIMPIKQNHLYLFPGWLQHYTEENKGGKRIVISFNTEFY